ncbi:MAG: radical SAM-associated putative lipoprotein [Bacteroidales bacterium]|nr:radical SAM-associated putative lipoprotein [Bacteroidales bacterium]
MAGMKVKFLKWKNWLLVTVMGALGFSSCHSAKQLPATEEEPAPMPREREEMRLMYGVPTMNFRVSGRVSDAKGRPVRNVRVNVLEHGIEATPDTVYGDPERVREYLESTSATTDREGRFEVKGSGRPVDEVKVLVRDVDGTANGSFRNQLLEVKVTADDIDRSEAEGWYHGELNKKLDIKLERR